MIFKRAVGRCFEDENASRLGQLAFFAVWSSPPLQLSRQGGRTIGRRSGGRLDLKAAQLGSSHSRMNLECGSLSSGGRVLGALPSPAEDGLAPPPVRRGDRSPRRCPTSSFWSRRRACRGQTANI